MVPLGTGSLAALIYLGCYARVIFSEKLAWEKSPFLPSEIKPKLYDLFLHPHLEEGTFEGRETITVEVEKPIGYVLLHSNGLNVSETSVKRQDSGEDISVNSAFLFDKNQFWVIRLSEDLSPGKYLISLTFSGKLTGKIIGFYRSTYTGPNGKKRYLATTKFEATFARQAFPCFDEPAFKANFSVTLVRPSEGFVALSNMNQQEEIKDSPSQGVTTVKFATTPPMSTYLACFIICDFDQLPTVISEDGIPVTVYAQPGQAKNMLFARDLTVKALKFYTEYFGIKYTLPKLDLIAIPDFVSGAMENWGLVTFRETSVFITEGVSMVQNYDAVANTVCHEVAHMWFGDLVTMAWWDDLWLNEGFASFLQSKCVNYAFSDWNMESVNVVKTAHSVLNEDAALSSHPIIQEVSHPDQINEIFDSISYYKGSAVLRMLEGISWEKFKLGVSNYLKQFEYMNAKTLDLWQAIQKEIDGVDIIRLMRTWTEQMGLPIINVARTGNNLTFTQERYLLDKDAQFSKDSSHFQYRWDVPLSYIVSSNLNKVEKIIFELEKDSVSITVPPGSDWIKINANQTGFYRVNYSAEDWGNFENLLKNNVMMLEDLDKANLIDDAFNLARSGYLAYDIPLSFISYFPKGKEKDYLSWFTLLTNVKTLDRKLFGTPSHNKFKNYARSIIQYVTDYNIWATEETDTFLEKKAKSVWVQATCKYEVDESLAMARKLFDDWISGKKGKPPAEIRAVVYKYGISGVGDEEKFNKIWELYKNEQDPQEKSKYSLALTSVDNGKLLTRLIDLIKDEDIVRSQDYLTILGSISENPMGNSLVWDFIKNNWEYLVNRFSLNDRYLGRLIPKVTSSSGTRERLNEVTTFFEKYPEAGAGAAGRKKAIESIESNIAWNDKFLPVISNWLENKL